jgi:hypothetical protein
MLNVTVPTIFHETMHGFSRNFEAKFATEENPKAITSSFFCPATTTRRERKILRRKQH